VALGVGAFSAAAVAQPASAKPTAASVSSATNPIKHVVVLLQENHSFDNVLGPLCAEVGSHAIKRPGTNSHCDGSTTGSENNGTSIPLAPATDYVATAAHSVAGQQADIDGGKMDGFNTDPNCSSQLSNCYNAYYPKSGPCSSATGSCIPNLAVLAERYTISDRTFESDQTPSWAGHLVWATANMDGFQGLIPADPTAGQPHAASSAPGWGCDAGTVTAWGTPGTIVPSCVPNSAGSLGPNWAGYDGPMAPYVPTIFDELQAKKLSWKLYGGAGSPGTTGSTGGHFTGSGWAWAICPTFAECLYSNQRSNLVPATNVMSDAAAGTLPSFSIITPTVANSQHNNDDMSVGDNWIGQVLGALEAGPEWSSTAVFVTYDDCGCFSDHVNPLQYNSQWGIRVPMVIVSPWAKAGYTDSKPTTFAGTLAFVEHLFGLPALDPSTDGQAYNYQGAFCFNPSTAGCKAAGSQPDKFVTTKPTPMSKSQTAAQAAAADDDT
jgi:phospholipase C